MINLYNLKPKTKRQKKSKRLGRGNSSNKGNYCGKGIKGQLCRSGGQKGLVLKGIKNVIQQSPKYRFLKTPYKKKVQIINLRDLQDNFNEGDKVSLQALMNKKLISDINKPVKILADGELTKRLSVSDDIKVSRAAGEKITGSQKSAKN
jgi:large subunit ribosomal protein L15